MPSQFNDEQWHRRFTQQAGWTQDLRRYLLAKAALQRSRRVLDVGCSTGALLGELNTQTSAQIYGLDISPNYLEVAMRISPATFLTQADAHAMPFLPHSFDVVLCHFVLLWVDNPLQVVSEMRRLARPGGVVLALAEPDYGARVDYPKELGRLGELQSQSLRQQGAQPDLGRRLMGLFHQAGLVDVECGVLGGQWTSPPSREAWESEWMVLEADLGQLPPTNLDLEALKALDWDAWQKGERILYVPTFYAFGIVPD